MSIRVYWLDARNVDPESVRHLMSAARLEKIDSICGDDGKRQSAAAEMALVRAMARENGTPLQSVAWRALPGGKPVIDGGLHFSLSHSGDVAVCAVSEHEIGADAEAPRRIPCGMRRKILSERETHAADRDLLSIWVAKESYLKLTGEGLKRSMTGFSAAEDRILGAQGEVLAHTSRLRLPMQGYELCVCSEQMEDAVLIELK